MFIDTLSCLIFIVFLSSGVCSFLFVPTLGQTCLDRVSMELGLGLVPHEKTLTRLVVPRKNIIRVSLPYKIVCRNVLFFYTGFMKSVVLNFLFQV